MKEGDRVVTIYGDRGIIDNVFKNFWYVSKDYIRNKKQWVQNQLIPLEDDHFQEEWYYIVLDLEQGDCLLPESRIQPE